MPYGAKRFDRRNADPEVQLRLRARCWKQCASASSIKFPAHPAEALRHGGEGAQPALALDVVASM
jgi:hypothetical protein